MPQATQLRLLTWLTIVVHAGVWSQAMAGDAATEIDHFENHIRPVLVNRCFECHSSQTGNANGGLQLDTREALLKGGDSGSAIALDAPEASLLLKAVRQTDPNFAMPPDDPPLTAEQVLQFEKWIAAGAVYPAALPLVASKGLDHWAFQPIANPIVPPGASQKWGRTNIDRFIWHKQQQSQVTPATDAPPEVVARRLSYVLTGLPPKVEAVDQFVATWKKSPDEAIANYTDHLLALPHFGERWTQHWLDLVRYAEGLGGEYDYEIPGAFRYRDYVTRAFNSDLPYDQFLKEQIAGDLLPPRIVNGTNETLLATAWWNFGEAATAPVDVANDEAERMDNRLDVLGKAFTGVTVGCARCHDHKFDPLPTREYYGLFGVAVATPAAQAWSNQPALDEDTKQLIAARQLLDDELQQSQQIPIATLAEDSPANSFPAEETVGDSTTGIPVGWQVVGHTDHVSPETAALRGVEPGLWGGLLSTKLPAIVRTESFIVEREFIDVLCYGHEATVQIIVANYQLIRDPIYHNLRQRLKQENGWHWQRFWVGRWKGQRAHVEVYSGTSDGSHNILGIADHADSQFAIRTVLHHSGEQPLTPRWLVPTINTPPELLASWNTARESIESHIPAPDRFLAVAEVTARDLPSFVRGNAHKPRSETVPRKSLKVWGDTTPAYQGRSGRLDLANAIASKDNPLTARVYVNRVWQHVFGQALVTSVDNFGLLGDQPTHPELLDYLAARFMKEHRWQLKPLLKELVTSRVFRLASSPAHSGDPTNRWYTTARLRRLDGEAIRDTILSVSGQIDLTLEGPPVLVPHQLNMALSDSGNNIPESGPIDGNRRRSLYLSARRNFPSEFLAVFDRPAPLSTFGKRDSSSSPAQALTLLNDPFVSAQAAHWGNSVASEPGSPDKKIEAMYRTIFSRPPTAAEQELAQSLLEDEANPDCWIDLAAVLLNSKEMIYIP
jgi:Protein of unknown function (DUF1553)/Protein of unknown function (DUF1549)/Planctomycete cytochrome C